MRVSTSRKWFPRGITRSSLGTIRAAICRAYFRDVRLKKPTSLVNCRSRATCNTKLTRCISYVPSCSRFFRKRRRLHLREYRRFRSKYTGAMLATCDIALRCGVWIFIGHNAHSSIRIEMSDEMYDALRIYELRRFASARLSNKRREINWAFPIFS